MRTPIRRTSTPNVKRWCRSSPGNSKPTSTATAPTTSLPPSAWQRNLTSDFVLVHCTEGHLIAEDLAEEGVCAITGPLMTTRSKPELANATDKNPGILSRHGVKTAICTDYNVMPIGMLPICAGMAVREGMDYQQALAAITIHPAQIVGIADRGRLAWQPARMPTFRSSHRTH